MTVHGVLRACLLGEYDLIGSQRITADGSYSFTLAT